MDWPGTVDESPAWYDGIPPEIAPGDAAVLALLLGQVARTGMQVVEVGSWVGNGSTRAIAEAIRPHRGALYCVDTWDGSDNVPHHQEHRARRGSLFPLFAQNVRRSRCRDVVRPLMMPSLQAVALFPDECLDLVFIDGNHAYSHVKQDILAWLPKVRPGGVLCGHDCDADYAALCPALRDEIFPHREKDTVKNVRHPGPPEFHGGVVRAVHEVFGTNARVWFKSRASTIWSYPRPGSLMARLRAWFGQPWPQAGDGPARAQTPWPESRKLPPC